MRDSGNYHRLSRTVAMLLLPALMLASCTAGAAPAPTLAPAPTATAVPTQGLVGTWTTTITKEDLLRVMPDFHRDALCDNAGTVTWKFSGDGTFTADQTPLPDCPTPANTHIEDTWSADGKLVTFAKGTPNEEVYEWAVDGETLSFKHVSGECAPCKAVNTANPWKRVSTSTSP